MDQNLFLMDQKQILLNKICYFDGSKTKFDDQNLLFWWIKITKFIILMDQNNKKQNLFQGKLGTTKFVILLFCYFDGSK